MTTSYLWVHPTYDTQSLEYVMQGPELYKRLGHVIRVIQARQHPNDKLFRYEARSYNTNVSKVFDTQLEAQAWVVACERID